MALISRFQRFFIEQENLQTIFCQKVKKNIIKLADSNRQMPDLLISF